MPPETSMSLPLTAAADAVRPGKPSPLEEEVVGLFDQLRERLLRYLLSFGLPVSDGEEIVQEVFLALFQHLRRGRPRENLRGWVFRVGHNLALKRRQAVKRNHEDLGAVQLADPALDPEAEFRRRQTQERLRAVVEALPDPDRHCLFLRAEGLRYREIAQVLDMSLGAVSQSLAKSLARLGRAAER